MKKIDARTVARADKIFAEAMTLHRQQKENAAQRLYRKVLDLQPDHVNALNALSAVYLQRGAAREAMALINTSLARLPQQPVVWSNLGLCRQRLDDFEGALIAYDQALQRAPDFPGALYNRGAVLRQLHRWPEALLDYERALSLQPDYADAHNNRGNVLTDLGRLPEAIESFSVALQLQPEYAEAWNNRGVCYWRLRRYAEAVIDYDEALRLKPDYFSAQLNRATALYDAGQYAQAQDAVEQVLSQKPDDAAAAALRYNIAAHTCDWRQWDEQVAAVIDAVQRDALINPFTVLTATDDPELQARAARRWWSQFINHADGNKVEDDSGQIELHSRRIRLAYLSADFHDHPVAHLMAGVFEQHDRQRFECFALSLGDSRASPMRLRLESAFEHFVDVRMWSDQALADFIREQQIDVLVDLSGYTQGGRPGVLVQRAAAIQVNYLGYSGTLGTQYVDYILGDKHILPISAQAHYDEKVVWMPGTYLCHDESRAIAVTSSRADSGLPETAFVFCCFNQGYKIVPACFDIWMRILLQVEHSVLWLSVQGEQARLNLQHSASSRGVDPARLIFAARVEDPAQHLARLRLADLFLDTLPYNAHATALDALWSGVPLLTCAGRAYAARVAHSLLHALDLPELITSSVLEYECAAARLAQAPDELLLLRSRLAASHASSAVFRGEPAARKLERAYQAMWERYQQGLQPEAMDLTES
jgi:protein O-GlcNAc transferase